MKTDINQRFIVAVQYLISEKIEPKKSEISKNLEISPSKFSEILNKRMSLGMEDASRFCQVYNISTDWLLLGRGEMLITEEKHLSSSVIQDVFPYNLEFGKKKSDAFDLLRLLERTIERHEKTIEFQQDTIIKLNLKLEATEKELKVLRR